MHKQMALGLVVVLIVVVGCQDTTTTLADGPGLSQKPETHEFEFAMLDDFAVETTGATGSGSTDVEGGSVEIEVKAAGLIPGHAYELNVTINFASLATFGPVTSTEDGEVEFKANISLSVGAHRLDFFVTHDHPTGTGDFLGLGLFDRDGLLRCAPAAFPVIE